MPKSVLIAIPTMDGKIHHNCAASLAHLTALLEEKGWSWALGVLPGNSLIDQARNLLLKTFLEGQWESILWIDADVGFDPEQVFSLLERPEKVVGGVYPAKTPDVRFPVALIEPHVWNGDLVQAHYLPGGMVRIKRSAIQDMVERFGEDVECIYKYGPTEIPVLHLYQTGIGTSGIYCGEDVSFSNALKACGYPIWVDPNMTLTHSGNHIWSGRLADTMNKEETPNEP